MTTFASKSLKLASGEYQIYIRSLNSRFLDLKLSLHPSLLEQEEQVRDLVQQKIKRGKIDLQIQFKPAGSSKNLSVGYNEKLVNQAHAVLKEIAKVTKLKYESIADLTQTLPLLKLDSEERLNKTEFTKIMTALKQGLDAANKQRRKEGNALAKNLKDLLVAITKDLHVIEKLRAEINEQAYSQLEKKIAKLNLKQVDAGRIEQEVVLLIDKSDVHEELVRLKEHLRNFEAIMREGSGKKLDFYTQELLRETNTIGAKSQATKITVNVVNMKCLIERIRELVQNIE